MSRNEGNSFTRAGKVKRTKTFTGCWTCRSRGVKCDERKPNCLKCIKLSLSCGGYGVGLVWPEEKPPKGVRRRVLPSVCLGRLLDEDEINFTLQALDSVKTYESVSIGLFTVFPAGDSAQRSLPAVCDVSVSPQNTASTLGDEAEVCEAKGSRYGMDSTFSSNLKLDNNVSKTLDVGKISASDADAKILVKYNISPSIDLHSSTALREERQLMHYWVATMSSSLVPTQRADNPFQAVFTSLALSNLTPNRSSSGHIALLHSIYALAAFEWENMRPFPKSQPILDAKHLQKSLYHLKRSLLETLDGQQEAILAAITMHAIIVIMTGETADWRPHIRGGSAWLLSVERSTWRRNRTASTLYQIFLCLEALRPAQAILAKDLGPQTLSAGDTESKFSMFEEEDIWICDDADYILDRLWGITKPIMEAIIQINLWAFMDHTPSPDALERLELKILLSNPSNRHFPSPTEACERMTRHHACTYYYACYIYFNRSILRVHHHKIQHLVRQSIEHIEIIELLEAKQTGSGLLWPAFITACEAGQEDLRDRIMRYYDKRETLGIGNVNASKRVVEEVWRRRDNSDGNDVFWHEVMADMNIDILLS